MAPFNKEIYTCCQVNIRLKTWEPCLVTEVKDVYDFPRPKEDGQIELQVSRVDTVGIQQVAQSIVSFLSESNAEVSYKIAYVTVQ